MNKFLYLPLIILLAGCASSERMKRLSGNVFDKYSTPKIQRLRSEKYHQSLRFAHDTKMGKTDLKFDKKLVNLWPFFFRSDNYISLLWPLIDFDRYGMAIRPFYNQEGDDYSIMFPYCAWNVNTKSGWAIPVIWSKDGFSVIPIQSHYTNANGGTQYYTPLYIHSWHKNKPSWRNGLRNNSFWEFCLGYYSKREFVDTTNWDWFFHRYHKIKDFDNSFYYRFHRDKMPIPKNDIELAKLKEKIFSALAEKKSIFWGFFPLFHFANTPQTKSLNIIGPLLEFENAPQRKRAVFFTKYILSYTDIVNKVPPWGLRECAEHSFILPFMGFFRCTFLCENDETKTLRKLFHQYSSQYFSRDRATIEKELQRIYPNIKLPSTVVDVDTLRLFLEDLCMNKELSKFDRYVGGFLPLYLYKFEPGVSNWVSPALFTLYENEKDYNFFFSLPLLTYKKYTPAAKIFTVGGPILWYSKHRKESRVERPIHSRTQRNASQYSIVEFQDDYAACALYYHGKRSFYIAKEGVDAKKVDKIRYDLLNIPRRKKLLNIQSKNLQSRIDKNQKWQTKTRLEKLRKELRAEEMRLEQQKLNKTLSKLDQEVQEIIKWGKKEKFPIPVSAFDNEKESKIVADKLFDRFAELRQVEDFGNGLFYRKELYYNGDYNYRLLFGLAAGEKKGDREDERILGFLYRLRKDKDRTEKIIFPFITSQTQGKDYQHSFLWRVYEKHSFNGKTGGHILFIPYGE